MEYSNTDNLACVLKIFKSEDSIVKCQMKKNDHIIQFNVHCEFLHNKNIFSTSWRYFLRHYNKREKYDSLHM